MKNYKLNLKNVKTTRKKIRLNERRSVDFDILQVWFMYNVIRIVEKWKIKQNV